MDAIQAIRQLDVQSIVAMEFWSRNPGEIPSLIHLILKVKSEHFDTLDETLHGEKWSGWEMIGSLSSVCVEIDFNALPGVDRWNHLQEKLEQFSHLAGVVEISGLSHYASLVELDENGNILSFDNDL